MYDTSGGGCFRVHNPKTNKTVNFVQKGNIYLYDSSNNDKGSSIESLVFDANADLTTSEFATHHPTTNINDVNVTHSPAIEGVGDDTTI